MIKNVWQKAIEINKKWYFKLFLFRGKCCEIYVNIFHKIFGISFNIKVRYCILFLFLMVQWKYFEINLLLREGELKGAMLLWLSASVAEDQRGPLNSGSSRITECLEYCCTLNWFNIFPAYQLQFIWERCFGRNDQFMGSLYWCLSMFRKEWPIYGELILEFLPKQWL